MHISDTVSHSVFVVFSNLYVCGFVSSAHPGGGYWGPWEWAFNFKKSGEWPASAMIFQADPTYTSVLQHGTFTPGPCIDWYFLPLSLILPLWLGYWWRGTEQQRSERRLHAEFITELSIFVCSLCLCTLATVGCIVQNISLCNDVISQYSSTVIVIVMRQRNS